MLIQVSIRVPKRDHSDFAECNELKNKAMNNEAETFDVERFLVENDLTHAAQTPVAPTKPPVSQPKKWDAPGFHGKARVSTTFRDLPIMGLRLRDKVRTISGEYKAVQWIDELRFDDTFLTGFPNAQPIRIGRGALGSNSPETDVMFSPAQKLVLKKGWNNSVTKTASELLQRPNVFRAHLPCLSYFLFHCGGADVVLVEGVWCHVAPQ